MKIDLPNVTMCAVDTVNPQLAALALTKSASEINFADVILLTDTVASGYLYTQQLINRINSKEEYSRFIYDELVNYIKTDFALIIQWDGYVLDASQWRPHFLDYDLIGAKWPWHASHSNIGNGGFTLRSRKLMQVLKSVRYPFNNEVPEDDLISRVYRSELELHDNIKFAPESIADQFSYERSVPDVSTFGFHGLFNMWRHVDDHEMILFIDFMNPYVLKSNEFVELLCTYFNLRKIKMLNIIVKKMKKILGPEFDFSMHVSQLILDSNYKNKFLNACVV